MNTKGFTIMEVIVVMSIFALIVALPMAFYWGIGRQDALAATTRNVVAAMHEAQTTTISGRSVDAQQPSSYGMHFESTYYDTFSGSSYSSTDPTNERTTLPSGITFSQINLPNSEVIFTRVTGQVLGFDRTKNSLTILESNTGTVKHVTISKVGSITHD